VQVAVISVDVVEGAVDEVVDVVAVGDGRVAAAGPVLRRALDGRARVRVAVVDLQDVLVHAPGAG
jgi:hypothetical protein